MRHRRRASHRQTYPIQIQELWSSVVQSRRGILFGGDSYEPAARLERSVKRLVSVSEVVFAGGFRSGLYFVFSPLSPAMSCESRRDLNFQPVAVFTTVSS